MMIHNLNEYAKARVIVKDLEKVLNIINATEASLRSHSKYRPVQYILTTISDAKPILELYLERYKIILETKGAKGI